MEMVLFNSLIDVMPFNAMLLLEFDVMRLIMALVISTVITFIVAGMMSNVSKGSSADFYTKEEGLKLTQKKDSFLYSNTVRTKIKN